MDGNRRPDWLLPMTPFAIQRIKATEQALDLVDRLVEEHGPVALFELGECSDGSDVTCLTRAELLPGDDEMKLGEVGSAAFYVDSRSYERAGRPVLLIDIDTGPARGLPLSGLEDIHFVIRSRAAASVAH